MMNASTSSPGSTTPKTVSTPSGAKASVTDVTDSMKKADLADFDSPSSNASSHTSELYSGLYKMYDGHSPRAGFVHEESDVTKIVDVLLSLDRNHVSLTSPNHHVHGMTTDKLPLLSINKNNAEEVNRLKYNIREILKDFSPSSIKLVTGNDEFDINKITKDDVIQQVQGAAVHDHTLEIEGAQYIKFLSLPGREWKSLIVKMKKSTRNYSDGSISFVEKVVGTIDDLDLDDGEWYTTPYVGETSAQTLAGRDEGQYPPEMYEIAEAAETDVVSYK